MFINSYRCTAKILLGMWCEVLAYYLFHLFFYDEHSFAKTRLYGV